MARGEVERTNMRPVSGMHSMSLPVTFDYSGGRKDSTKTKKIWSAILAVVGFIIAVGTVFNKNRNFLLNLLIAAVVVVVVTTVIRFLLLGEAKIRSEKIKLIDSDNKIKVQEFWGIYEIGSYFPYICRFRNGRSGIFVRLNKDVILGKAQDAEFEHYEAIGDGYNICGSSNIQICHIDYMDTIGSDERIDDSFASLAQVTNPDVKNLLTDIYVYQQELMSRNVSTFDAYLFLWSGNDDAAWDTIQRILACFLDANFRSYRVLNRDEIRDLAKVPYLLKDFSAETAMIDAFMEENTKAIIPISVRHSDGSVEKLNKSTEERRVEMAERQKAENLKKEELARRKAERKEKAKKPVTSTDGNAIDEDEEELF